MLRTVIVAVGLSGCWSAKPAATLESTSASVAVETCRRVEGSALGALPLVLEVGDVTVRFAEWTTAEEGGRAFYGFAAQVPAGVRFTVKAGERTFVSASPRWLHPLGIVGPATAPIDSIEFCASGTGPAAVATR